MCSNFNKATSIYFLQSTRNFKMSIDKVGNNPVFQNQNTFQRIADKSANSYQSGINKSEDQDFKVAFEKPSLTERVQLSELACSKNDPLKDLKNQVKIAKAEVKVAQAELAAGKAEYKETTAELKAAKADKKSLEAQKKAELEPTPENQAKAKLAEAEAKQAHAEHKQAQAETKIAKADVEIAEGDLAKIQKDQLLDGIENPGNGNGCAPQNPAPGGTQTPARPSISGSSAADAIKELARPDAAKLSPAEAKKQMDEVPRPDPIHFAHADTAEAKAAFKKYNDQRAAIAEKAAPGASGPEAEAINAAKGLKGSEQPPKMTEAEAQKAADVLMTDYNDPSKKDKQDIAKDIGKQLADLAKTSPENAALIGKNVIDDLRETKEPDNVMQLFVEDCSDETLKKMASTESGRDFLKSGHYHLLKGNVSSDERTVAKRIDNALQS
jgi:hypothetical protein